MTIYIIDDSSKYHTTNTLRQARCSKYSDPGNCDSKELLAISEWARYMAHPLCSHVDEEDVPIQRGCKEYYGVNSIELKVAAGEAHWHTGIVERHIGAFSELCNNLLLGDLFEDATLQSVVNQT